MSHSRCMSVAFVLVSLLALPGCQKATEKAAEITMEKAMEDKLKSEGTDAKVDLSDKGFKAEMTDANGQKSSVQMGGAKVTEAELQVPIYPGAQHDPSTDSLTKASGDTMALVVMTTKDDPAKVQAFYRDYITKKWPKGQSIAETQGGPSDTRLLMSTREDGSLSVTVSIEPAEAGSKVSIMTNIKAAAPQ
jgi:hypothetical protein